MHLRNHGYISHVIPKLLVFTRLSIFGIHTELQYESLFEDPCLYNYAIMKLATWYNYQLYVHVRDSHQAASYT